MNNNNRQFSNAGNILSHWSKSLNYIASISWIWDVPKYNYNANWPWIRKIYHYIPHENEQRYKIYKIIIKTTSRRNMRNTRMLCKHKEVFSSCIRGNNEEGRCSSALRSSIGWPASQLRTPSAKLRKKISDQQFIARITKSEGHHVNIKFNCNDRLWVVKLKINVE